MGTRGEERLKAITDAATEVVAERGYYGMTIQEVSDRVGITQAGLLKYVKNKNGLLMPEYYRTIAEDTMKRPQLTQLYLVLRAEAIDPNHPAHEYYAQRGGRLRAQIGSYPWKLPPEYNTPQKIGLLSMCVGSAMEGLQSRWLGEPDIDFMSSWSQYENILFPRPHWNGYR